MANDLTFSTKVSGHGKNGHEIRGIKLEDLVNESDFVSSLYLMITGQKPTPNQVNVLNAILVASLDHGIYPASGFVPRVVTASGNGILTAMASTLMALGPYHGAAITPAMESLQKIQEMNDDIEKACQEFVQMQRTEKKRVMGYGHPKYKTEDPRAQQLLKIARANAIDPKYLNIANILESTLEREFNKKLVLNIDGAIAAILLSLGFEPAAGNGIFALARVGGSIAHIVEEQKNSPIRRLDESAVEYSS